MQPTWKLSTLFTALLVVSACGSAPDPNSFGGRLQSEGGEVAKIGESWSDGEKLIAEGRELIEDGENNIDKGESRIAKGRKQVRRGEEKVRDGERMKREAEAAYRLRTGTGAGG